MKPSRIIDKITDRDLEEYAERCSRFRQIDKDMIVRIAKACIRYYNGDEGQRDLLVSGQHLENRWYASLASGTPDYGVYDDDYYVSDIWSCWVVYSRKYLKMMENNVIPEFNRTICQEASAINGAKAIIDVGCGFGYTTATLKEQFPNSPVFGTNLEGTMQYQVATDIGKERGFSVVPSIDDTPKNIGVVFASEFFEHLQEPAAYLNEIIKHGSPKFFVIANAFGSRSIGHFNTYRHQGRDVPNTTIGKLFNQTLKQNGYQKIETKFWNGRPAVWKRW